MTNLTNKIMWLALADLEGSMDAGRLYEDDATDLFCKYDKKQVEKEIRKLLKEARQKLIKITA